MVDFRLVEPIEGDTRTITATGTTSRGQEIGGTQDSFPIHDTFLLGIALALYQNAIWLLVLAIIVLVLIIILFIIGKKKDKEQEQKEETSPTSPQKPT